MAVSIGLSPFYELATGWLLWKAMTVLSPHDLVEAMNAQARAND
jgi:hypothetical protein